ncbi:hypothetical protein PIB30_086080 [Stylosanthes scabra]|uniref:DUF2439 domain-containing protein n=1 Tax=Stylosanthes scabra TaxID=79078 RepID=A0ABU6WRC2_9FABA|nr:hypothetical protein [Stylosanthes scabra]
MFLVYKKIDGGKKKAFEDGEVAIQSSKCGILTQGTDTCFLVSIPMTHKAQSMPRPSSSMTQVQDHARTALPPCLGVGFHHSPRLGVARKPMTAPGARPNVSPA